MRTNSITLNIAGVIINMHSRFPMQALTSRLTKNYRNRKFVYRGKKPPKITININITPKLPSYPQAKTIFQAFSPEGSSKDWIMLQSGNRLIYSRTEDSRQQIMVMNRNLGSIQAYLLPKDPNTVIDSRHRERTIRHKGYLWNPADLVYDFLQILILGYLSILKKDGLLIHGAGVKDMNNRGLIFVGKSGSGKTTLAKIYHTYSQSLVLNDECVVIRKQKGKFYIYSSPWHGEFQDYFCRGAGRAPLKYMLILNKSKNNALTPLPKNACIDALHSSVFFPFWSKNGMENALSMVNEISAKIPCLEFRFKKEPSVINFIRNRLRGAK